MAGLGGALEPDLGLAAVGGDSAAEPIGLAEVEGGVAVALGGERPPDGDGTGVVALLPRLDAGLHAAGAGVAASAAAQSIAATTLAVHARILKAASSCCSPTLSSRGRVNKVVPPLTNI